MKLQAVGTREQEKGIIRTRDMKQKSYQQMNTGKRKTRMVRLFSGNGR